MVPLRDLHVTLGVLNASPVSPSAVASFSFVSVNRGGGDVRLTATPKASAAIITVASIPGQCRLSHPMPP
jgi:hypothetical protein